jgi:hypothetical protein
MKITFICPFLVLNGGHRVVATYAEHLQARGHEVTIVSRAGRVPSYVVALPIQHVYLG